MSKDVILAVYGALRLARFDARGLEFFEASPRAFWRSFLAAVIIAPFFALLIVLRYKAGLVDAEPVHHALVESVIYVIAWVIFPVVMVSLTEALGRFHRDVGFIVAYNWCARLQNVLFIIIGLLHLSGGLSRELTDFLSLAALLYVLVYTGFVAKHALEIMPLMAAGVVAIDFGLAIALDVLATTLS